MRADVYLHHVRIFKTRSLATKACGKGNVRINGAAIKPARDLKVGDPLEVARADLTLVFRVLDLPAHRVGAPLVPQFLEDMTPPEHYRRAAESRRERALTSSREPLAKPDKKQLRAIRQWLGRQ